MKDIEMLCDFVKAMTGNVPSIAAAADLELQNFKLRTNEQ